MPEARLSLRHEREVARQGSRVDSPPGPPALSSCGGRGALQQTRMQEEGRFKDSDSKFDLGHLES